MKILCIGDFHIPERAGDIPIWIRKVIIKEKPDLILCTGDTTSMIPIQFLSQIAPVKCVKGNMDSAEFPKKEMAEVYGVRIGLVHGTEVHPRGDYEQLFRIAKGMGVDVLVHGHTHNLEVKEYKGVLFVNPGSATGVWGGSSEGGHESFIILEIDKEGKIKIRKFLDGKEV
ncbi:MAG: YfcE family phosphodiesterase [Candidatus Anstonellales archaeon]